MSEANPYAAPAPAVEQQQTRDAGLAGRIGVPPDVELPLTCAICSEVQGTERQEKWFRIPRPQFAFAYLAFILVFVFYKGWPLSEVGPTTRGVLFVIFYGLTYFTGPRKRLSVPLCPNHVRRWRWGKILTNLSRGSFVAFMVTPPDFLKSGFFFAWLFLIVIGPRTTRKWLLQSTLAMGPDKKLDTSRLWLLGVHEHAREVYIHAGLGVRG